LLSMAAITKTYKKELNAPARAKNLIICLDGTWNDETGEDGDGVVTNIVKLYQSFANDSNTQVSRYFRGVGNDDDFDWWGILTGGLFGSQEKMIRRNAYSTLVKEYQNGDHIFIFGFSRGAACARMLAQQIEKEGIPEQIEITTKPKMNRTTRQIENKFLGYQSKGRKKKVPVAFLGVWDTVGAFGLPINFFGVPFSKWNLFKDMSVAPNVQKAVHLVAIDETRDPFKPTLMNHRPGVVEEIWFPGVHADVGGGYAADALGRITLEWMITRVKAYSEEKGFPAIDFDQKSLKSVLAGDLQEVDFHFHGLGWKKSIRDIHVLENNQVSDKKPLFHQSVFNFRQEFNTYSLIEKFKGNKRYLIQYNPFNLKALKGNYGVVL